MSDIHARIEILAGAIALGEASDAERSEYREHIATCARCLQQLGGEREIERVASTVAQAREQEVWQPDLGDVVLRRTQFRARRLRYGAGVLGACVALSLGVHLALAGGLAGVFPSSSSAPSVFDVGTTRIVLEQRSGAAQSAPLPAAAAPAHRTMVVLHNVVSMQRATISSPRRTSSAPREIASMVVHPDFVAPEPKPATSGKPAPRAPLPSWHTIATTTTTSLTETAPSSFTHSAESIQFGPVKPSREAQPIGGETAINPKPPMIAYDEGAEGTSAFEVLIDERGNPTKCVITKSSGYAVLDTTVCKAAMSARYSPKVQDGRAVSGVYHDAFTFRVQDDPSMEGIPQQPAAGTRPGDNGSPQHPGNP